MSLTPGQRLGSFEVVSLLGAGGMGEVYLASDTVLGRSVAIKVLPEVLAHYPDSVARFEREAKTLAALNHPHIAQIFGFEKTSAALALVMELVEGPTLAERIASGPMPLDEALPIAAQIADALEAAHAQGIIHRDLKPANVKVRLDGTVKVLDFGLAKVFASHEPPIDVTQSPTLTSPIPISRAGLIVGTTAYMSPEQARGKAVDKRTDIWAFGCVLYEMLTGTRAFVGDDATETIAAIVKSDIDWTALPAETPAVIRRLLKHLLAKDPRQRTADIADARLEIADAMSASEDSVPPTLVVGRSSRRLFGVAMAAALLGGIGGVIVSRVIAPGPQPSSPSSFRFTITLGPEDYFSGAGRNIVAVSPTGAHIAYAANQRLYLRGTNQLDSTVVADSDRGGPTSHGRSPFFSADGEWLAYWQGGEIRKVSVHGSAPSVICQAPNPLGATWTAANTIFFGGGVTGIWRVDAAGGVPEVAIKVAPGEYAHGPQLLPDGKSILFTLKLGGSWDDAQIVVQTPGSDERTTVVSGARDGRYMAGRLVYAQRGTLFGVAFDPSTRTARGQAVPLIEHVGDAGTNAGTAHFSTSNTGLLVYGSTSAPIRPPRVAVWVDRQGHEERISTLPERPYMYPRLSPDGQKVAVTVQDPRSDIWVYDLQRGTSTRLTFDGDNERSVWRPDGQRIAIASSRDGANTNLYSIAADGSGSLERLTTSAFQQVPEAWARSGDIIAYSENRPETGWNIWTLSLSDHQPAPFLQTRFHDGGRLFSPDGHWLVYYSDESGRGEVQVRAFPSGDGKSQISSEGGAEPVWSRNGRELFYRNGTKLMVVDVALQPTFHASAPRLVFDAAYVTTNPANFDVSPDGLRFLMLKSIAPAVRETPRLIVVQNWFDELERLVPSK